MVTKVVNIVDKQLLQISWYVASYMNIYYYVMIHVMMEFYKNAIVSDCPFSEIMIMLFVFFVSMFFKNVWFKFNKTKNNFS